MQMTPPTIVTKPDQPYAGMRLSVRQREIGQVAPPLVGDIMAWLGERRVQPAGPVFFDYTTFLPDGQMEMIVGVPTATLLDGAGKVETGVLPGGQYASTTHTGTYSELHDVNMALDDWARAQNLDLDGEVDGDRFWNAHRVEFYISDPDADARSEAVTEVAFRIAD